MTLHVLVVGADSEVSVCGTYRTLMYVPHLAPLGVEVRYGQPTFEAEGAPESEDVARAIRAGNSEFERNDLAWADVVVFRRAYQTHLLCRDCGFVSLDLDASRAHARTTGHNVEIGPHWLVRPLVDRLEAATDGSAATAIVYETDDDLLDVPADNDFHRIFPGEADLVERLARMADLVTVSTPVLAARLRPLNARSRVVRNAIDPDWYGGPPPERGPGDPRILYYGAVGRLRDYAICRDAVDEVARTNPGTRRVWLGAPSLPEHRTRLAAVVDELRPYVVGVPAFARALREASPDIGLAPVLGDWFDRAKSELHWLEYSMAGAATVASRTMEDGPYRVIRPGVDGLVARSKGDWRDALGQLARSPALRADLAGRARERVLADYAVAGRAQEWAEAFRWAAAHAGEGRRRARPAMRAAKAQAAVASPAPAPSPSTARAAGLDPQELFAAYVAARRFAGRSPLRLHLGCGETRLDGFVNIDAAGSPELRLDPAFGLPFDDASVDAVYGFGVVDELGEVGRVFAAEAARVLRKGGVLRLVTRDRERALERRARLTAEGLILTGPASRIPSFDAATLGTLLRAAGFSRVAPADIDVSAAEALCGLESRRRAELPDDVLVVEALR